MTKEEMKKQYDSLLPAEVAGDRRPTEPLSSSNEFYLGMPQLIRKDVVLADSMNLILSNLLSNDKVLNTLIEAIKDQLASCDLPEVTQLVHGIMSAADKKKLDGIATNANNYTHPNSGVTAGTYKSVTVNGQGHVTGGSNPTTLAGYGITDAAAKSHGNHVPTTQTANNATFLRNDNTWQKVTPGNIGAPTTSGGGASGTWVINISGKASTADKATSASSAVYANKFLGSYSGDGGRKAPSYFGRNYCGALMSNQPANSDTSYKNWLYMDCYSGTDAGGATAIGVSRSAAKAFIMQSSNARSEWNNIAEIITNHNIGNYLENGRKAPTMTQLVDWEAMTKAVNLSPATVNVTMYIDGTSKTISVPAVKNRRSTDWGVIAYGGDNGGNLNNGDIILRQSYKNFDQILIAHTSDDANWVDYTIWDVWKLTYAFEHSRRFTLVKLGGNFWWLYGSKRQGNGSTYNLSTETRWYTQNQNNAIVEIYGLKY